LNKSETRANARHVGVSSVCALATVALCVALATPACSRVVPIGQIVADPRKYEGATVDVQGQVGDAVNLFLVRAYTLRDDSGSVLIVTQSAVPRPGETVLVRGIVNQAFALGDKSVLVIREAAR
jgi:hypothetical protein